jgi:hypothetical protein
MLVRVVKTTIASVDIATLAFHIGVVSGYFMPQWAAITAG